MFFYNVGEWLNIPVKSSYDGLYFPNIRFVLDISQYLVNKTWSEVVIHIKNLTEISVDHVGIEIEDKKLFTNRMILSNKHFFSGDKIGISQAKHWQEKSYSIVLEKAVFIEEDISKNCSNYPNEEFSSYNECDEDFIRMNLGDLYSVGYVPLWSTQERRNITSLTTIPYSLQNWYKKRNLFSGFKSSDCQLPCTRVSVDSKLEYVKKNDEDDNQINLIFINSIEISKTDFANFNIFTVLSFIGGNMGLWLGLGMVQFFEIFMKIPVRGQKTKKNGK